MVKRIAVALAAAVLIGAVVAGTWWWSRQHQIPESVAWGTVDARRVSLAFEASGRIKSLAKEEGEAVHPGEELGALDTQAREIDLKQAQAQLASLQASLDLAREGYRKEDISAAKAQMMALEGELALAENTLRRQSQLFASRATSKQALDNAQWNRNVLAAQLQAQRSNWQKLSSGLREPEIRAQQAARDAGVAAVEALRYQVGPASHLVSPVEGVIRSRLSEPGDMTSAAKTVYEIAITTPKWVRAFVTEKQLGYVREGGKALVTTDTTPTLQAVVGYVSSQAEFTPKTVQTQDLRSLLVYEVRLNVEDPDNCLKLGQPVTVDFASQGKTRNEKFQQ